VKKLILLAVIALALAGCDGIGGIDGVNVGPAVFGTVYDATTKETLSDVRIEVSERVGTSNQLGSYYVAQVPKGTHTLKASKQGYVTFVADVDVVDSMVEKKVYLTRQ
jgi:2-keto-3-deoxy-L-rhamnonate aldolase RhmA